MAACGAEGAAQGISGEVTDPPLTSGSVMNTTMARCSHHPMRNEAMEAASMTEDEMKRRFDDAYDIVTAISDAMAAKKMLVARYDGNHVVDATEKTVELLSIVALRLAFLREKAVPAKLLNDISRRAVCCGPEHLVALAPCSSASRAIALQPNRISHAPRPP